MYTRGANFMAIWSEQQCKHWKHTDKHMHLHTDICTVHTHPGNTDVLILIVANFDSKPQFEPLMFGRANNYNIGLQILT